jgi:hypothetical protein
MRTKKYCFLLVRNVICYRTILCVLFFCSSLALWAQDQTETGLPFITNYSPKTFNAMPQTWSVMEDESGMMYFGIQNYILEYDGVKWRKITLPVISSASVVRALTKNKEGTIYYGGFGDIGYLSKDSLGQTKARSYQLHTGISLIYGRHMQRNQVFISRPGKLFSGWMTRLARAMKKHR